MLLRRTYNRNSILRMKCCLFSVIFRIDLVLIVVEYYYTVVDFEAERERVRVCERVETEVRIERLI